MEILREGITPSERMLEAECGRCACKFRFKASEGRIFFTRQLKEDDYVEIACPFCKKSLHVRF